jgi:hypothetical protein
MRGTIVRIGATGAGALLALGLLAAPPAGATGSGRESKGERSGKVTCFNGEGRTQGRSLSDPDGDSNGGADKPGCGGGFDADKDGNNGCGNDADREDDNNGNCGRRQKAARVKAEKVDADIKVRCQGHNRATTTTTSSTAVAAAGSANGCSCPKDEDTAVLGASDVKAQAAGVPAAEASTTTTTTAPTTVMGSGLTAPAAAETTTSTTAPETQVLGETLSQPDTLARTGAGIGGLALLGGLLCAGGRLTVLARKLLRIG